MQDETENQQSFEEAGEQASQGLVAEFVSFMRENAKWWLIPFVIVFALLGGLLILGATGAAPFIYALF